MTNLTENYLSQLLQRHPEGDIHETATRLQSLIKKLESEASATAKETLLNEIRSYAAVLEHELDEDSRGGEDFINDGKFSVR